MLKFGRGTIMWYDGHFGDGILRVTVKESELFQKFYIDTKKYKCRKVASCDSDMNCLFDGTGVLYYMEVEPVFYK